MNGGLRIGELRLNVGGLVDPSWIGRRKAKRRETEMLREDGTPGPGEETDEVALRRRKGEKGGWMAKKLPRTPIKVGGSDLAGENFHLLDQNLFGRRCKP